MRKKLFVFLLLMSVSTSSISCAKTKPAIKDQKVFWGNKEQICSFLATPEAKSERWFIQALGQ